MSCEYIGPLTPSIYLNLDCDPYSSEVVHVEVRITDRELREVLKQLEREFEIVMRVVDLHSTSESGVGTSTPTELIFVLAAIDCDPHLRQTPWRSFAERGLERRCSRERDVDLLHHATQMILSNWYYALVAWMHG